MNPVHLARLATAGALTAAMLAACAGTPPTSTADDRSASTADDAKRLPLTVLATIEDTRPGNITVTPDGRIIITQHPLDAPELRVVELLPDGRKVPFPNPALASAPDADGVGIAATIGIASDTRGVVWILDMGGETSPPRIVAWNTRKDALHAMIAIPPDVLQPDSFLQDFALDEKRKRLYIADMTFPAPGAPSRPAFVVVDLETAEARRVLEGAPQLMPADRDVIIGGSPVARAVDGGGSAPLHLGLNPIAIDPAFEWVYFGTINGLDVFRLPAAALADPALDPQALAAKIERYAPKVPSDGIAVDGQGRVFITDIQASAVGVATPDGYRLIAQDDVRLSWPDGFALGPQGRLYVTQNNLHGHPGLNAGKDGTIKPFRIVRIDL